MKCWRLQSPLKLTLDQQFWHNYISLIHKHHVVTYLFRFPHFQNRHARDHRIGIVLGSGIHSVVCTDHQSKICLREVIIDFVHFQDNIIRYSSLGCNKQTKIFCWSAAVLCSRKASVCTMVTLKHLVGLKYAPRGFSTFKCDSKLTVFAGWNWKGRRLFWLRWRFKVFFIKKFDIKQVDKGQITNVQKLTSLYLV